MMHATESEAGLATIDEVLSFWFGEPAATPAELLAKMERWFPNGAALDAEIKRRFTTTLLAARSGLLDSWAHSDRGRLALILVLDQFPRHVYRGRPECYASDARALAIALEGLDCGPDRHLPLEGRIFLRMPLGHAEDVAMQERSACELEAMLEDAEPATRQIMQRGRKRSRFYLSIIRRFGRFPHRNAILGRESTAEESAFLEREWPHPPGGGA